MAPEQLEGEEADARTDIFALECGDLRNPTVTAEYLHLKTFRDLRAIRFVSIIRP